MTNQYVFCVVGRDGGLIDVAKTEKGAKRIATKDLYTEVYRRNVITGYSVRVAVKRGERWYIA
jgi:hypothetical protein